ncbi:MAG: DNA replication/repair protein RecF [Anaerovoracaceae bacterium]
MYIKNIKLKDFRNYENIELNFNSKINFILGRNAQGKTNLLEAIYITSIGKSFRTNRDSEMISFNKEFSRVYAEIYKDESESSVEIIIDRKGKKFAKLDGVKIKKASELLKNVYIVIFSPEDLKIVKDEPEKRRKFIDRELCQIKPAYYDNIYNYKKVLLQKNTYLKEKKIEPSIVDIWDLQLAKYGAGVMLERNKFIEKLNTISSEIYDNITAGKEKLTLNYDPNVKLFNDFGQQEEYLYETLKKFRENDLRQGNTSKGPHKDDIEFYINGINARNFGSQGQQRTCALSLKLAEIGIIEEETGEKPILLLDDVMSELDIQRQEFLIKSLNDIQIFITTTEIPDKILEKFPEKKTFIVKNGQI